MGLYISKYTGSANAFSIPTSIDGVRVNTIGTSAFSGSTLLTSVTGDSIKTIGQNAFSGCTSLVSISFPKCISISTNAFYNTAFYINQMSSFGYVEYENVNDKFLIDVTPSILSFEGDHTIICDYALANTSAYYVSFPNCKYIGTRAFYMSPMFRSIYLMGSIVCSLASSVAFSETQINRFTGSIIVPSSLASLYRKSYAWSYFASRIFGA